MMKEIIFKLSLYEVEIEVYRCITKDHTYPLTVFNMYVTDGGFSRWHRMVYGT